MLSLPHQSGTESSPAAPGDVKHAFWQGQNTGQIVEHVVEPVSEMTEHFPFSKRHVVVSTRFC